MVSSANKILPTLWPPDDTEESILGSNGHQFDIFALRLGLNELAEAQVAASGGPLPWEAISQVLLLGCRRPDGSAYTVSPDIAVFTHPMDLRRGSYSLAQDGVPVLVVELASPSTVRVDLDVQRGKGWSYAQSGIAEYLVLDPSGEVVADLGRGWLLLDGVYHPWQPDEDGRWRSAVLPCSLGVEAGLAAVWDRAGERQVREREVGARERAQRKALAEGKRSVARRLARTRFGIVASLETRIDSADDQDLDTLLDRLVTAARVEDL